MQLLVELLEISEDSYMESLFENLGNIGKLGLGSMANAFKQTYNVYQRGPAKGDKGTSEVGNKFAGRYYKPFIGPNSNIVELNNIKNWTQLKKAAKNADDPEAAVFYVEQVPVALMIAPLAHLDSINDVVGLAWDFSKVPGLTDEGAAQLVSNLNSQDSDKSYYNDEKSEEGSPKASAKKITLTRTRYSGEKTVSVKKYAGYTQTVREFAPFVKALYDYFGGKLSVKLIETDRKSIDKRHQRFANQAISPSDIKLFKDDIKTRLAKYKNSKLETVDDAKTFFEKVLSGGAKKITLAGKTYTTTPSAAFAGKANRANEGVYSNEMARLIKGNTIDLSFSSDSAAGEYKSLSLRVKLVNGTLTPVEARYYDENDKYQTITF